MYDSRGLMSQLSFECNEDLRLYDFKERQKVIKRIERKHLPLRMLKEIREHYYGHLSKPYGTPDNYVGYHPEVIAAVKQHFPTVISDEEIETYTQKKLRNVFGMLAPLIEKNERVNINPLILKMYLEYLKPSEVAGDFTVDASLYFSGSGVKTDAERKTEEEQ